MKKGFIVFCALLLLVTAFNQTSAGGGGQSYDYGYENPLLTITDIVKDDKIREILSKNILSLMGNNISEDSEYNMKNFYTKKIQLNIDVPAELLTKIKSAYIGFSMQNTMGYEYDTVQAEEDEITLGKNNIKIDINLESIPTELELDRKIFNEYITDSYGGSFVGNMFLELTDGTTIPFSNTYYLYVNADTQEGKTGHLSNIYYSMYPYSGSADLETILKKYFTKLETKMGSVSKYVEALEKINEKVDLMTKKYELAQGALTKNISSEANFMEQAELYGKITQKYTILTDLKWRVGSEIQTRNSEGVLEELFGDDN